MKKLLLFLLLTLSVGIYHAKGQIYFPKDTLLRDLDTLYTTLHEVHPDIFTIVSQEVFEKELSRVKAAITDSMTVFEFFSCAAPLIASIGDGHTSLHFPWKTIEILNPIVFPFLVDVEKGDTTLHIKTDLTMRESKIPIGSRIVKINGRSDKEILRDMTAFVSGESLWFKMTFVTFNFAKYLYLLDSSAEFAVEYIWNKETFHDTVRGIPCSHLDEWRKESSSRDANYSLTVDEKNNVAVFEFEEFEFDDGRFEQFADSIFTLLKYKEIDNLIIDLRNNGGGNSRVGDLIFQYISPVPFVQYGNTKVKISAPLKRQFKWLSEKEIEVTIYEGSLIPLNENPNRFVGNVYLLTSSATFSSATDFAWAFQYFNMGTIIGEETGGYIVCFGDTVTFKLPGTGVQYGISWKEFYGYGATDAERHGVIPDIPVPANKALSKALEIISSRAN